jgi:crotonobetainyl-CoA:carnitine CoA-transferase CaiB-like acyl-CoA transferase
MISLACLAGIRVLDCSRVFAGPWAAQMLADLGADVVKVENPVHGDDNRQMGFPQLDPDGQPTGQMSSFLAMNRGKRSIAIDIASPEGRERLIALAARADVMIENFKAGTLARYGLDYAALVKVNPRLVLCSITGFGQDGPYAARPSYDAIAQAMSGVMSTTGHAGQGPSLVGYSVSDINAGFYASIAILAALHHRDMVSGEGQHIDLSLLDAQMAAQSHIAMNYLVSGRVPTQAGSASQINTPWQAFETAEGSLMVTVGNNRQFRQLCLVLGVAGLADDARFIDNQSRFAHREMLLPALSRAFAAKTAADWLRELGAAGVPVAQINDFSQALQDPQLRHREMVRTMADEQGGPWSFIANPIRLSATPIRYDRAPPRLDADADDILADWLGEHPSEEEQDDR